MQQAPILVKAGIGSRTAALFVDYALVVLLTQLAGALLFGPTGGFVRDSTAFYNQCEPARIRPVTLELPPTFVAKSESVCTASLLGWPVSRSYVVARQLDGSAIRQTISYWIDSNNNLTLGFDLTLLQWPLLAMMRWGFEHRGGRSPGRALAGLNVGSARAEAEFSALSQRLRRRYILFALAGAPNIVVSLGIVAASGLGSPVPNALAAMLTGICGLVPMVAVVAAAGAILKRRDTFYDAAAGTSVVRPFDTQNDLAGPPGDPPSAEIHGAAGPIRGRVPWATLVLCMTLTAIFIAEFVVARSSGRATAGGVNELLILIWGGASYETVMQAGQWYRLITASFLHWDVAHLFANLLGLLAIGFLLEPVIGVAWFVTIFLLGGLGGAATSISWNGVAVLSAGASTALMALLAAGLVLSLRMPEGDRRLWLRALCLVGLASTLTSAEWVPMGKLDFFGHIGGAVTGALVGLAIATVCWRDRRVAGGKIALSAALALSLATFISVPVAGFGDVPLAPLLIPPAEMPKTDPEWVARAGELAKRFPRDPRSQTARAVAAGDNAADREAALASVEATARALRPAEPTFSAASYRNALVVVGKARRQASDFSTAKAMFTRAIAVALPTESDLLMLRADAEQALGEFQEAKADLERSLAQQPDHIASLISLALVRSSLGDQGAAIATTEAVIKRDPRNFAAWRQKGWFLFLDGRYSEAVTSLQMAREIGPNDQYAAIWLYLASMRAGKEEAVIGTAHIDMMEWPAPVIRYLARQITPEVLRSAAASRDPVKDRAQRCEANFYLGASLPEGEVSIASIHLRAARENCPKQFYEWTGAKVELAKIGK